VKSKEELMRESQKLREQREIERKRNQQVSKIQRNIIVVPGKELVEQWADELTNCNFKKPGFFTSF
jgi:superfamily II DNA or RNA helicase